jgi:hypothetical protein
MTFNSSLSAQGELELQLISSVRRICEFGRVILAMTNHRLGSQLLVFGGLADVS